MNQFQQEMERLLIYQILENKKMPFQLKSKTKDTENKKLMQMEINYTKENKITQTTHILVNKNKHN